MFEDCRATSFIVFGATGIWINPVVLFTVLIGTAMLEFVGSTTNVAFKPRLATRLQNTISGALGNNFVWHSSTFFT